MSLNTAIPVRFSDQTQKRLKSVSEKSGLGISKLVRMATEDYLDKIESSGCISILVGEGESKTIRLSEPSDRRGQKGPKKHPMEHTDLENLKGKI